MKLNLPENGRVVVIDDNFNEALPLINVLSKNGIPVTYFTGLGANELPTTPLPQIKVIFLDILLGTEGQREDKNIISPLMSVLSRIVDSNNGPYIIIGWTKHDEYLELLRIELEKKKIEPVIIFNLEKSTYCRSDGIDEQTGETKYTFEIDALESIEKKIIEELSKAKAFHLFILWENLVHKSTGEIVQDFSSFYPQDGSWDKNMCGIFHKLAKAYAGEQLACGDMKELIKNALLAFNGTFLDALESNIKSHPYGGEIDLIEVEDNVNEQIQAIINSKLLLLKDEDNISVQPGNIYELGVENRIYVGDLFNDEKEWCKLTAELFYKIKYILLEVSSSCDYAQDKWRVHRLLSGVMLPREHYNKIKKKSDYIYSPAQLFEIDGEIYNFVFDLRYLLSSTFEEFKDKIPVLRMRHELLVDIQSHIARHINRPGIVAL